MMIEKTLQEYLADHSQASLANDLNISRTAIYPMLKKSRDVRIVIDEGKISAWEKVQIPGRTSTRHIALSK